MQIYFLEDLNEQIDVCSEFERISDCELLQELQKMFLEHNHSVRQFKTLYAKIVKSIKLTL